VTYRNDFTEAQKRGVPAWLPESGPNGEDTVLFPDLGRIVVIAPVHLEGFGKTYAYKPPTFRQRVSARIERLRYALARPLQWLADRVRGYEERGEW
jgi:hypothetical protein